MAAIGRSRWLIATIVIVITGATAAVSLILPKRYEARATIVAETGVSLLSTPDAESQQRRLATLEELIRSSTVLGEAAVRLGQRVDERRLEDTVSSHIDPDANLIDIAATDESPELAAEIANTVAGTFLDRQRALEQQGARVAIERFREQIEALEEEGEVGAEAEVERLRGRIARLQVESAGAGAGVQVAQRAEVPDSVASPRPVRNAAVALFAALLLGVLVALARDQLQPLITSPRELARLTGLSVLAGIPRLDRRLKRHRRVMSAIEHEAYEMLSTQVQLAMPDTAQQVILVTSAVHGEGKTTVTGRLGRVLAEGGNDVLLVGGDLRWPRLDALVGVPPKPGLSNMLASAARNDQFDVSAAIRPAARTPRLPGTLDVLPTGSGGMQLGEILASDVVRRVFEDLRALPHRFVLVDTPPLLGIADVQRLAAIADGLLIVFRLDGLTLERVADLQEQLDRLPASALGAVVIGARIEVSPYYLGDRIPAVRS